MELLNKIYTIVPTLTEKTPWIDKNRNSKVDKDEVVPMYPNDIYRKEPSEGDKIRFLISSFSQLKQTQKDSLILESMKYITFRANDQDRVDAEVILRGIGQDAIPEAMKYIDDPDKERHAAIVVLLDILSDKEIKNPVYIKNVCLPKLRERVNKDSEMKNSLLSIILNLEKKLKKLEDAKKVQK